MFRQHRTTLSYFLPSQNSKVKVKTLIYSIFETSYEEIKGRRSDWLWYSIQCASNIKYRCFSYSKSYHYSTLLLLLNFTTLQNGKGYDLSVFVIIAL